MTNKIIPTFHDELFIAIKNDNEDNLAFSVPVSTGKKFEDSKESARNWAYSFNYQTKETIPGKEFIVKNEPISGIEFIKVVSRWSTSNKWFTVKDPRGFSVQISAENLHNILCTTSINNGKILDELVYCRANGHVWLINKEDENYKNWLESKDKPKTNSVEIGDIVVINGNEHTYIGPIYARIFAINDIKIPLTQNEILSLHYYARYDDRYHYKTYYQFVFNKNPEKYYACVDKDDKITLYKNKNNKWQVIGHNDNWRSTIVENTFIKKSKLYFAGSKKYYSTCMGGFVSFDSETLKPLDINLEEYYNEWVKDGYYKDYMYTIEPFKEI